MSERVCREGPHVNPCGPSGWEEECACGCRADDFACWAEDDQWPYEDDDKTSSQADNGDSK